MALRTEASIVQYVNTVAFRALAKSFMYQVNPNAHREERTPSLQNKKKTIARPKVWAVGPGGIILSASSKKEMGAQASTFLER